MQGALAGVEQNRPLPPEHQFVWTVPGWPMAQILWEGQTPERRRRVTEAFKLLLSDPIGFFRYYR